MKRMKKRRKREKAISQSGRSASTDSRKRNLLKRKKTEETYAQNPK